MTARRRTWSGWRARVTGAFVSSLLVSSLGLGCCPGCAVPAAHPWIHPTPSEWQDAVTSLDRLRSEMPELPYTASVTTVLRDARSGQVASGRGAIAIAPGRGLRMILVGGAGATLLDAWVTPERFRIAVPPLAIVRRGRLDAPAELPVAFLRWWFFARLHGSLIAAAAQDDGWLWVLRDGDAVAELRSGHCSGTRRLLRATRFQRGRAERVDECRSPGGPGEGDRVRYVDESVGLEVELSVDAVNPIPPAAEAFLDPDETSGVVAGPPEVTP